MQHVNRLVFFGNNKEIYMKTEQLEQRILFLSLLLFITLFAFLFPSHAHAAKGLARMAEEAAAQSNSVKNSLSTIFTAIGFAGVGYGAFNLWRKGKEGEQSRITAAQIFIPMVGGAALAAVSFMLTMAQDTVGIQ